MVAITNASQEPLPASAKTKGTMSAGAAVGAMFATDCATTSQNDRQARFRPACGALVGDGVAMRVLRSVLLSAHGQRLDDGIEQVRLAVIALEVGIQLSPVVINGVCLVVPGIFD